MWLLRSVTMFIAALLCLVVWAGLNQYAGNFAAVSAYVETWSPLWWVLISFSVLLSLGSLILHMLARYRKAFEPKEGRPPLPIGPIVLFSLLSTLVDTVVPSYGFMVFMGWRTDDEVSWTAAFVIAGLIGSILSQFGAVECLIDSILCFQYWKRSRPEPKKTPPQPRLVAKMGVDKGGSVLSQQKQGRTLRKDDEEPPPHPRDRLVEFMSAEREMPPLPNEK